MRQVPRRVALAGRRSGNQGPEFPEPRLRNIHPDPVSGSLACHEPRSPSMGRMLRFNNHPSGDHEPSDEDVAITKRLVEAGRGARSR